MKPIVYYLDDNKDALQLASVISMSDERFDLVTFMDETAMCAEIARRVPTALILDLNLGNGFTGTILAAKYRLEHPDLPIAIYTSYDQLRAEELVYTEDLNNGMTRVWSKSSIDIMNLPEYIAELVEMSKTSHSAKST